jgi:hypothetical protein
MNLFEDLRSEVVSQMKSLGIKYDETGNIHKILVQYYNIGNKLIPIRPRNVHKTDCVKLLKIEGDLLRILNEIESKFTKGEDVNPYLSRNILDADFLDYLLDDWGIHHLHLSNKKDSKGNFFMERSDYLLFVKVYDNDVYFIDVQKHKTKSIFAKQELLQIFERNWPEMMEPYQLKDVMSVHKPSDKEIEQLRKGGAYVLYEVNGKVFTPIGGGLTSARTNINHTIKADDLLTILHEAEKEIVKNIDLIKLELKEKLHINDHEVDFKLIRNKNKFIIIEVTSGTVVFEI